MFRVSSSKHHVSISAVAQKVNLGNLGVRNAMRPKERALPCFWASCAVVVRYAIVTIPPGFSGRTHPSSTPPLAPDAIGKAKERRLPLSDCLRPQARSSQPVSTLKPWPRAAPVHPGASPQPQHTSKPPPASAHTGHCWILASAVEEAEDQAASHWATDFKPV